MWFTARRLKMNDVQARMSVAITKEAMDFEASMTASLINGTIQKGAEMDAALRGAGLAAQGIGQNLDIVV